MAHLPSRSKTTPSPSHSAGTSSPSSFVHLPSPTTSFPPPAPFTPISICAGNGSPAPNGPTKAVNSLPVNGNSSATGRANARDRDPTKLSYEDFARLHFHLLSPAKPERHVLLDTPYPTSKRDMLAHIDELRDRVIRAEDDATSTANRLAVVGIENEYLCRQVTVLTEQRERVKDQLDEALAEVYRLGRIVKKGGGRGKGGEGGERRRIRERGKDGLRRPVS